MSDVAFPGVWSRQDPDLSDRLRQVFVAAVQLHSVTARPVGSETIAQRAGVGLSAASVRAALAELEAMGLLERHHSSSGRMPTARGYELYVRALLPPAELPEGLGEEIDRILQRSADDVEALLHEASRLLSTLTRQLGLAVALSLEEDALVRLDLEQVSGDRVLLALGLAGGVARTLVLELDSALDRAELGEVAGVLRERLVGGRLRDVRERLARDPGLVRSSAVRLVVRAALRGWAADVAMPLYSAGALHIARQPEFASSERLGPILAAVEYGRPLDRLMVSGIEGQAGVRVGLDPGAGLESCSLVSFPLPGSVRAAVGVLGPLRMNYSHALAVVDRVGHRVADLLQA
jgi:heat-inducible transcriptional repressor